MDRLEDDLNFALRIGYQFYFVVHCIFWATTPGSRWCLHSMGSLDGPLLIRPAAALGFQCEQPMSSSNCYMYVAATVVYCS